MSLVKAAPARPYDKDSEHAADRDSEPDTRTGAQPISITKAPTGWVFRVGGKDYDTDAWHRGSQRLRSRSRPDDGSTRWWCCSSSPGRAVKDTR